jgi:enterochelin esterase family protein
VRGRFSSAVSVAIISLIAAPIQAQAPADSAPSSTATLNSQFPGVSADRRVTFRVRIPDAKSVEIVPLAKYPENNGYNGLGKGPFEMTKRSDGEWTVTTPPAVPGLHYYYVQVDGATFADPSSRAYFAALRETSAVEVPEKGTDFYLPKKVPHGAVRLFWHYSKLTDQWRKVYVYLPPDYDTETQQRYPVLYLRHGGSEDESGWIEQGHANFILDNLIAAGKAMPMIIVMERGYAVFPGKAPEVDPNATPTHPSPEMNPEVAKVTIEETIPAIDANFRTIPDRDHRAMAGLSMGSLQTLSTTMHHLDVISAMGVFSRPPIDNFDPKTIYGGVMADASAFNNEVHLLWFGAGTSEPGIYASVQATRANLEKGGIKYQYVEYPGLSHEWQVWRKQLNDFAPLLFRW